MATPGKLVETMADTLGLPIATVTQYDRQLAEHGLRSRGGRGTSAAKVTPGDAANLLISIMASPVVGPSVKAAAETCRVYGSMLERSKAGRRKGFGKFGLIGLGRLRAGHTLAEALTVLIAQVESDEILRLSFRGERPRLSDHAMAVEFDGPDPWAQIVVSGSLGAKVKTSDSARFVYTPRGDSDERYAKPKGDLHQRRFITFSTIWALGECVRNDKPDLAEGL